jgi:hypothetical protein
VQAQHTAAPIALFTESVTAGDPVGWSTSADVQIGSREFTGVGELLETDLRIISGRVGLQLLPYLQPWVEAGTSKADRDSFDGENGLFIGGGLQAELMQWILSGNPSLERKKALTLGGQLAYRSFESNSAQADFTWREVEFAPGLTYTHNRLGEGIWIPYQPLETNLRGNVVFSHIDGEFGNTDIEGNRNFGFRLGADLLWLKGFTTSLNGTFYGDKDRMLHFGMGYRF